MYNINGYCLKLKNTIHVFVVVVVGMLQEDDGERKARDKQARVAASIKDREKEVQESLAGSLKEREKERDQHKRDEVVQDFKVLLLDMVGTYRLTHVFHSFIHLHE